MKKLKAVLEAEMGDYVEFRVSKYSQEKRNDIQNEISSTLEGMELRGGWSVGYVMKKQKVVVEAHLTEQQRTQLINHYGADLVEVKISGVVTAMVGYVVKEKDGKILVVDPNVQDYGAQGGEKFHYNASWYSNVPPGIRIGQKIEVKVIEGPTTAQYPGDNSAEEVIIIPGIQPDNAKLLEEEAIRKAMASNEYEQSIAAADGWLPVIKEAKYNDKQSSWSVVFTNESTDQVVSIHVEDK
ncbi:YobA family protein [Paenibacillus mendelii]|nr:YobA family protein [Paenibacillus mendelii]